MASGFALRVLALSLCALLGACAAHAPGSAGAGVAGKPAAMAELSPTIGNAAHGTVTFEQKGDAVVARAEVKGLAPGSLHGFHIHETGDCSAPDASSAGAHFDPTVSLHGGPAGELRHGGDLGNLKADANGVARGNVTVGGISVDGGPDRIVGRAVVIHAAADDLTSQPAGNAGGRIACGVINPASEDAS
jgi:Cu-Zn family superoxide dismutase